MKFLIVEDEVLIQKSLKKMLERKNHEVDATASGIEAIELIHANDYHRIVCDLMLNDITGFDILEDIRSKFTKEDISKKFIIITAYSSPQVLDKANQYGCKVLNKPFDSIAKAIDIFIGSEDE